MRKNRSFYKVINGCKVAYQRGDSLMDPCNCSSYYTFDLERRVCFDGNMWNYKFNYCQSPETVLNAGTCDPDAPWDRCEEMLETRTEIKINCIEKGFHMPPAGEDRIEASDEMGFSPLPRETQLANVELAFASMFAGCVITLMVVAMVMEFCNFPHLSKRQKVSVKNKAKPVPVNTEHTSEAGNVSVEYEYIDEEGIFSREIPLASGENSKDKKAGRGHTQLTSAGQKQGSLQHHPRSEVTSNPVTLSVPSSGHVVPKTKILPRKKEKGGKTARPPLPPQLEHKESSGYIHPVYD